MDIGLGGTKVSAYGCCEEVAEREGWVVYAWLQPPCSAAQ